MLTENAADRASTDQGGEVEKLKAMDGENKRYMLGDREPVTSSVLISNSKYLNNPYYRDIYAQIGLRRHGHDLPTTYLIPSIGKALSEVQDAKEYMALIEAEKAKNADFAEWINERRYTSYSRGDLEGMAPGTLGHAIWELLGIPGLQMELEGELQISNDLDYLAKRRATNHDIEHIVTGFGPNAAGEMALALANIRSCASYFTPELAHEINVGIVMINSGVMHRVSAHYPAAMPIMMDAMCLGIQMGQMIKRPLLLEPWEDMLDKQVEDIVADLGIIRGPGAGWDWTTAATTG